MPSKGPEDWGKLLINENSEKTLAYCQEDQNEFPPDVKAGFLESGIELFENDELLLGLPEYKVSLPGGSRASQNDIFVLAKGISHQKKEQLISIAVEGKVNEDFGKTICKRLGLEPSSGLRKRVQFLLKTLEIERLSYAEISGLRYQLLQRAASAILLAQKFMSPNALMLIHSFSESDKGFVDYEKFVSLFGLRALKSRIIGPATINGNDLYFGWIRGDPKFLTY
ncbi:hypothetical protein CN689_22530 [Peribacillus butanolivorans]|uniref:DUF6946 domain-containing protein n=1 Tax=Peribacillus butanolivorans TaxID=421767 RepID=A0AAX0S0Z5_9BACI|nr:hypothetical protein [Peribacillus butanolivorans]PEJ28330.1 hypothetical protein CN689_22530 [Peribacillus butanolivorans]